jgi:hypothetical protein
MLMTVKSLFTESLKEWLPYIESSFALSYTKLHQLKSLISCVCNSLHEHKFRAGSLVTVSKELLKYRLDLEEVQDVKWEGGETKHA